MSLYINKEPDKKHGGEWFDPDQAYFIESSGLQRTLTAIYLGGRKVWELIVGFIFTKDGFSINTKDDYIVKCKGQ